MYSNLNMYIQKWEKCNENYLGMDRDKTVYIRWSGGIINIQW